MAELKYVDWDGLVYYDGKIKEYIKDRDENYIKMGGIISFEELPDPSYYNLHYIYKIKDEFVSNSRFDQPGLVYAPGTWVECVDLHDDASRYRYIIFEEKLPEVDLSNYYTKDEVEDKIESAINSIDIPEVNLDNYYTKDEVDNLLPDTDSFVTEDKLEETLTDFVTEGELEQYREDIVNIESTLDEKADKTELTGLASEEFVLKKIAEAEIADKEADLEAYYTKSETEAKIKEAIDAIEIPDVSGFATKEEVSAVQEQSARNEVKLLQVDSELFDIKQQLEDISSNYVTNEELEDAINSIEHPVVDLDGYATKEYVDNAILNIPETDLSDYYTKSETNNIVEEKITALQTNIENNYVTNQTLIDNYTTTEQLASTYVTQTVLEENYITNNDAETKIEQIVEQKVQEAVTPDSIKYDTWD